MVKKRISVELSEDEYSFIKWLAKRDKVSEQEELNMIFSTELREVIDLYSEEYENEKRD